MKLRFVAVAMAFAVAAMPVMAEDDGEEFLQLMRRPAAREQVQRYIDNAANKWEGRVVCTPQEDRDEARFQAVFQWFEAHPTEMWRPQRYLIMQGLMARYACPKS